MVRVGEGFRPAVLVFDSADILQVLGAIICNSLNRFHGDELSPALDITLTTVESDDVLVLACLIKFHELVEAGVEIGNGDRLCRTVW